MTKEASYSIKHYRGCSVLDPRVMKTNNIQLLLKSTSFLSVCVGGGGGLGVGKGAPG